MTLSYQLNSSLGRDQSDSTRLRFHDKEQLSSADRVENMENSPGGKKAFLIHGDDGGASLLAGISVSWKQTHLDKSKYPRYYRIGN